MAAEGGDAECHTRGRKVKQQKVRRGEVTARGRKQRPRDTGNDTDMTECSDSQTVASSLSRVLMQTFGVQHLKQRAAYDSKLTVEGK